MADSQNNYWGQQGLNRVCFGLGADVDHDLTDLQQQQPDKDSNSNSPPARSTYYSDAYFLTPDDILRTQEGDQVVPSSQRRTAMGGHQKQAKPLPPLPDPEELMCDEAADNELEFFTSDRQRLLPKSCPRAVIRGSRDCGQVNHAYQDSGFPMAFSWPGREDRAGRGVGFGIGNWAPAVQRGDYYHPVSVVEEPECDLRSEHHQSSRTHLSGLGSAVQPHINAKGFTSDKPLVPPRIPIPLKPPALLRTMSTQDEDKPPKIPPRVPLVPPCPPRDPSPKSLPIYINGVMPATQSFAANPKYVSKASHKQQRERAPPTDQVSPCIVPILKDGRQASATHYILLPPGRSAYADRRERLFSEPTRTGTSSGWQNT